MPDKVVSAKITTKTINITSITVSSGTATVTVTAHGLIVGQQVLIAGGTAANNGLWNIVSVPTVNTLTITSASMVAQGAVGTLSSLLELNDGSTYRVADGSFENQATQHRRKTATNPFIEGEYVVSSLRGNITEQVNVYVKSNSQYVTRAAVKLITDALEQPTFTFIASVDNWKTTWTCYTSDYTLSSSKPLLHSSMVQVQIQLLRDPVEVVGFAGTGTAPVVGVQVIEGTGSGGGGGDAAAALAAANAAQATANTAVTNAATAQTTANSVNTLVSRLSVDSARGPYAVQCLGAATGSVAFNVSTARAIDMTLAGNVTLTITNPPASGTLAVRRIIERQTPDGTTGRTVTRPASFQSPPTQNTNDYSVTAYDIWTIDGGTTWNVDNVFYDRVTAGPGAPIEFESGEWGSPTETDDNRLTNILSYVGAMTQGATIQLPPRWIRITTGNRMPPVGMKMRGWTSAALASSPTGTKPVSGVRFVPASPSPLWDNTNTSGSALRGLAFEGIAWRAPNNFTNGCSWFTGSGGGTFAYSLIRDCTWYSFQSVLGTQQQKLVILGLKMTGWLEINNSADGAIHIGGSDSSLFTEGMFIDSASPYDGAGQYHIWFDQMDQTDVGPFYATAENGWLGVRITGPAYNTSVAVGGNRGVLTFSGTKIEGRNANQSCYGNLVRIEGGAASFQHGWFGSAMANPSSLDLNPITWAASAARILNQITVTSSGTFRVTTAGTSAGTVPTWSSVTALGNTITDGSVTWTKISNSTVIGSSTQLGVIHQTGGYLNLDGPTYQRGTFSGTPVAESVPFVYSSGGVFRIRDVKVHTAPNTWTGKPVVAVAAATGGGSLCKVDDSVTLVEI